MSSRRSSKDRARLIPAIGVGWSELHWGKMGLSKRGRDGPGQHNRQANEVKGAQPDVSKPNQSILRPLRA